MKSKTYCNTSNLLRPVLDRRVNRGSRISLGGAAPSLGTQVNVDSEKVGTERSPPVCNQRLPGFVPDAAGRFDASRVEAAIEESQSETRCRNWRFETYLSVGKPLTPPTSTGSREPPAFPFTSFKTSGRYKNAVRIFPPGCPPS